MTKQTKPNRRYQKKRRISIASLFLYAIGGAGAVTSLLYAVNGNAGGYPALLLFVAILWAGLFLESIEPEDGRSKDTENQQKAASQE